MSETRLILMSATLNASKFKNYFSFDNFVPPVIQMKIQRPYKIEINYLDELVTPENDKDVIEYKKKISITNDMLKLVGKIIAEQLEESEKSILVFLPGVFEIECMVSKLLKCNL
jgi:HrpA-like RNA helicase